MFDRMHMAGRRTGVFIKGAGRSPEAETHLREQQRRPVFGRRLYSPQREFKP